MLTHLPIAVQVFSVRDDASADFKGTMQKLKDMGYDGVELAGLYSYTPAQIRQMLDEVGIPAISAHVRTQSYWLIPRVPLLPTRRLAASTLLFRI